MSDDGKLNRTMEQAHHGDDAPAFDLMWRRAQAQARSSKSSRGGLRLALGAGLVAAVALAAFLLTPADQPAPHREPADSVATQLEVPVALASLSTWQGPTDFLLETTGNDLLQGSLQIGVIESLALPNLCETSFEDNHTTAVDGGTHDQNHP